MANRWLKLVRFSWFLDDWQDPELSHEIAGGAQRELYSCAPPQSNQNFAERAVYDRVNVLKSSSLTLRVA
jgi:hypothetical protein